MCATCPGIYYVKWTGRTFAKFISECNNPLSTNVQFFFAIDTQGRIRKLFETKNEN